MSIINAIAAVIAWFAAQKVDDILGTWVAYFTIAWENAASSRARQAYSDKVLSVQREMSETYGSWEEWRKKVGIT